MKVLHTIYFLINSNLLENWNKTSSSAIVDHSNFSYNKESQLHNWQTRIIRSLNKNSNNSSTMFKPTLHSFLPPSTKKISKRISNDNITLIILIPKSIFDQMKNIFSELSNDHTQRLVTFVNKTESLKKFNRSIFVMLDKTSDKSKLKQLLSSVSVTVKGSDVKARKNYFVRFMSSLARCTTKEPIRLSTTKRSLLNKMLTTPCIEHSAITTTACVDLNAKTTTSCIDLGVKTTIPSFETPSSAVKNISRSTRKPVSSVIPKQYDTNQIVFTTPRMEGPTSPWGDLGIKTTKPSVDLSNFTTITKKMKTTITAMKNLYQTTSKKSTSKKKIIPVMFKLNRNREISVIRTS
ncbi:hypothetical protein O3M35_006268 [Rhynocoris fuscipes]|uniref:Uncharacterized protein n=1 Tax=Rhynocoris fuscipes TaxID=488301 RepID=A0AAW1DKA4_9HEMI